MTPRAYAAGLLAAARRGGGRVVALPDGGAVVAGRRGHDRSVVIPGAGGHASPRFNATHGDARGDR